MEQKNYHRIISSIVMLLVISASLVLIINAEPEGATVTYDSETMKNATPADSRTDAKGNITTIILSTIQQDTRWKAYVGNVSGTLVLRDAEDYSIYEWDLGGDPDGEVYITMNSTIDWSSIQCANTTDIQTLETALGHGTSATDNIRNTFSKVSHSEFQAGDNIIGESTCNVTTTWVNNSEQADSTNAYFQEILLMDASSRIVFATLIDQNTHGYRDDTSNETSLGSNMTYDFQAIVPDFTTSDIATYYFYVEISG